MDLVWRLLMVVWKILIVKTQSLKLIRECGCSSRRDSETGWDVRSMKQSNLRAPSALLLAAVLRECGWPHGYHTIMKGVFDFPIASAIFWSVKKPHFKWPDRFIPPFAHLWYNQLYCQGTGPAKRGYDKSYGSGRLLKRNRLSWSFGRVGPGVSWTPMGVLTSTDCRCGSCIESGLFSIYQSWPRATE
jgi:hypothetical protein